MKAFSGDGMYEKFIKLRTQVRCTLLRKERGNTLSNTFAMEDDDSAARAVHTLSRKDLLVLRPIQSQPCGARYIFVSYYYCYRPPPNTIPLVFAWVGSFICQNFAYTWPPFLKVEGQHKTMIIAFAEESTNCVGKCLPNSSNVNAYCVSTDSNVP